MSRPGGNGTHGGSPLRPAGGLTHQPTELQPRGDVTNAAKHSGATGAPRTQADAVLTAFNRPRRRLELRPISTVLERYLAELASRSGLPRPGILSPEHCRWAAGPSPGVSERMFAPQQPGPSFESRV